MKKLLLAVAVLCICFFSFVIRPQSKDYISTTVSIPANKFKSLRKAYDDVNNRFLSDMQTKPIDQAKYHMTLTGYNISLADSLKDNQKEKVKNTVTKALKQSTTKGLQTALNQDRIALQFDQIGIFRKKVVALFSSTRAFHELIIDIDANFKNNRSVKNLLADGLITSIKPHQTEIKPHVSVADIEGENHYQGNGYKSQFRIPHFIISSLHNNVSTQIRSKELRAVTKSNKNQSQEKYSLIKPILRSMIVCSAAVLVFFVQKYLKFSR